MSASYTLTPGSVKGKVSGLTAGSADYTTFSSIVINATNGHVWQAGDSGDTMTWSDNTGWENCSDVIADQVTYTLSEYPACEYCYNLSLCNNGSIDDTGGNCAGGSYGGAVTDYGQGDWRVPTGDDSYTAGLDYSDYQGVLDTYFATGNGFVDEHDFYWTGTTHVSLAGGAYVVYLDSGDVSGDVKGHPGVHRVRCVSDQ